jgi:FkbH-like protein
MFEFDQYQRSLREGPPVRRPPPYRHVTDVTRMSFMVWGEHCIECADPGCYTTCDLYQRRPDGRCRRFAYGIYRNRRFPSLRGYGAEISFKTWGKLEADGNIHLEEVGRVLRRERSIRRFHSVLRTIAAAAFILTRNPKWKMLAPEPRKLARRLHRHRNFSPEEPSSFLLEVYNPAQSVITLQLVMRVVGLPEDRPEHLPSPFLTRIDLPLGYSRHRFECKEFRQILDSERRFKVTLMPEGDAAVTLIFLTADFVVETRRANPGVAGAPTATLVGAEGRLERPIKCVVFDLDHTLWDGTLLEGGVVSPREEMVRLIRELDKRGILISIASKNDFGSAWERLESLDLAEYFVWPEINWSAKSESIRKIANRLNIGLDTFAFVDDSPFELAEVTQALPMVACFNADAMEGILDQARFRGGTSADAVARRGYYKDAIRREQTRTEWGSNYIGFVRSCEMKLTVRAYQSDDFARVAELVQRTNQLNFSGRSYRREDLADRLEDVRLNKYVLSCRDRYGSYGTVGFGLVSRRAAELRVEDLMVSCRVQGRFIEQAFFLYLVRQNAEETPSRLWVGFNATGRNDPARHALERMNFSHDGSGFILDLVKHDLCCDVVEVLGGSEAGTFQAGGTG